MFAVPAGLTWQPVSHPLLSGVDSKGSFMDASTSPPTIYHATPTGIYKWPEGQPQQLTVLLSGGVHSFAAGRGDRGNLTLAYVDRDAAFCEEVSAAGAACSPAYLSLTSHSEVMIVSSFI